MKNRRKHKQPRMPIFLLNANYRGVLVAYAIVVICIFLGMYFYV